MKLFRDENTKESQRDHQSGGEMQDDLYYSQMTEYYDGAKYDYDFESVRQSIVERYEKHGPLDNQIIEIIRESFAGRRVLEIACGAGFWTRYIAEASAYVMATDVSRELVTIAQSLVESPKVEFRSLDARDLTSLPSDFDAVFHFNYINHVPLSDWDNWLDHLHSRLMPDAVVLMGGQAYQGDEYDEQSGDFYSSRSCPNGKTYRLVDNYPDEQLVRSHLRGRASDIQYTREHGWCCIYTVLDNEC